MQANNQRHLSVQQLMKTYGSEYFLANVLPNIDMAELIRWYYNAPIKTRACLDGIFAELKQRISAMDANNLEANKEALFEICAQSQNGRKIPSNWAHRISDIVRIKVQQQVDDVCSAAVCNLESRELNSGIISNELLEALAYFGQEIILPSAVITLRLRSLELTSLWLRFKEDSRIQALFLDNNEFEELNHRTFGQFMDGEVSQQLKRLGIRSNAGISVIDFDELKLSNIEEFYARGCVSLSSITNIPRSVRRIDIDKTSIKKRAQMQFKRQTGNNLWSVFCDDDAEDEVLQLFCNLHPGKRLESNKHTRPGRCGEYIWKHIHLAD